MFIFKAIKSEKILIRTSAWTCYTNFEKVIPNEMCQSITCQKHLHNPIKHLSSSLLWKSLMDLGNYFYKNLVLRCLRGFWMYFAKIFRTHFSKHLCFTTFLGSFFKNQVWNDAYSSCFIQRFQVSTKNFM